MKEDKRPWEPMELSFAGHIGEVIETGEGKLTPPTADPGEALKPPGQA